MRRPHVVVIGGGFGGLQAARGLRRLPVDVTLVDRKNHHVFQPLLYQVATAGLSPAEIAAPIRHILRRQRATRVLLGEVTAVDLAAKTVKLDSLELAYDYLILATGEVHSYFGHDEWQAHAPGLKTLDEYQKAAAKIKSEMEGVMPLDVPLVVEVGWGATWADAH